MDERVKGEIMGFCANTPEKFKAVKKILRTVDERDLPAMEKDFYNGEKLLDGKAICGDEFVFIKHSAIILHYSDCTEANMRKNTFKDPFRKPFDFKEMFANTFTILEIILILILGAVCFFYSMYSVPVFAMIWLIVCLAIAGFKRKQFIPVWILVMRDLHCKYVPFPCLDGSPEFPMDVDISDLKLVDEFNRKLNEKIALFHSRR